MLFFFFLNVQSYQVSNFLSLSPDDQVSLKLAEGIQNTGQVLESLSSDLSQSLKSLGLKLDNSLTSTSSSLLTLLDSEIQSKKQLLSSLSSQIHYLLRNSNNIYEICSDFRTCEACSFNPLCVWCEVEQLCVGGDQDGPFHAECSYFSYQSCFTNGCRSQNSCRSCVQSQKCGWCLTQAQCFESSDSCQGMPFIHFAVPGASCPDDEPFNYPEVYVSKNPTGSEDLQQEQDLKRIQELREESSLILQDIQKLELAKDQLVQGVQKSSEIVVNGIQGKAENDLVDEVKKVIQRNNRVDEEMTTIAGDVI